MTNNAAMNHVLCFTECFQFQEVPFIVSVSVLLGLYLGSGLLCRMCPSVLTTFSSMRFSVAGFMRCLIHLDLTLFMVIDMSLFSFFHVDMQLCQHYVKYAFFPFDIFLLLYQKSGV